jgi:hypothetical protein
VPTLLRSDHRVTRHPPDESQQRPDDEREDMAFWAALLLLVLPLVFLVWSGVSAVRRRRAHFGRGYRAWTGRKGVTLGYCWIVSALRLSFSERRCC